METREVEGLGVLATVIPNARPLTGQDVAKLKELSRSLHGKLYTNEQSAFSYNPADKADIKIVLEPTVNLPRYFRFLRPLLELSLAWSGDIYNVEVYAIESGSKRVAVIKYDDLPQRNARVRQVVDYLKSLYNTPKIA
ncbi:MAG: hypothetical protein HY361_04940 [Candidatus Aenigmarchaeota archaeon]|nr:hypothetical protein [Candidatus Aenigmarchaeota archaeon]